MLGLPDTVTALLFDLDGVLTDTAGVHNRAWKRMFDDYLAARADAEGTPFVPFDPVGDYNGYVDGRPRADGVRSFLLSRGIELPDGTPDDPVTAETVNGLGNRKNALFNQVLKDGGLEVFAGSRRYLQAAYAAGLRRAVVSSSANTRAVLEATGLADLVELRVDGVTIAEEGLRGKPAPDTFLLAAERLGVPPAGAAVFEDALAGVEAGRAGGFGAVIGVDRLPADTGHGSDLAAHGATRVVRDLQELL